MPRRFRDAPEYEPTIDAASERLGISPTAVEKDYWVSEVLRVLAGEFPDDFVFKGGTSLSKAHHLVQRFSEDIDILVLRRGRGRSATDTLMKDMAISAAACIGGKPTPVGGAESGRHRAYEIGYAATRPAATAIRPGLRMEMGVRGGTTPGKRRPSVAFSVTPLPKSVPISMTSSTWHRSRLSSFIREER